MSLGESNSEISLTQIFGLIVVVIVLVMFVTPMFDILCEVFPGLPWCRGPIVSDSQEEMPVMAPQYSALMGAPGRI